MCSTRNTGLAASIGADTVIDYTCVTQGTQRYDVILDNVANHRLPHCLRALTRKGTLVPNANTPGRWFGGLGRIIKAQVMAPFMPQRIRTCHGLVNQPDLRVRHPRRTGRPSRGRLCRGHVRSVRGAPSGRPGA